MLKNLGVDGIYIVHAKKGYEIHEQRIIKLFSEMALDFEFVTDGDVSCFNEPLLNKYFTTDIRSSLGDGTLSCTLNHILCYERIVKNGNKFALVFENDPFFLGNFFQMMSTLIDQADTVSSGFIVSLENTILKFPPFKETKKGKVLYAATYGRCAGAYLIDLKGAQAILDDLKTTPCHTVIDWWHNSLIDRDVVKMYWAHPALTEQGSHNGLMSSVISSKSKSFARRLSWLAQKFYKTYITRWFK